MVAVVAAAFPLICGHTTGIVKVDFPAPVRLPARIAPASVRLNGVSPQQIEIQGRTVTIQLARPKGITCDSISVGPLRIAFSAATHIRLGMARTAVVTHGTRRYAARIGT